MKKVIFTFSFIGILVATASAQYFHRYKALPDPQQPLLKGDTLSFYPEHQHRYSERLFKGPENLKGPMAQTRTTPHYDYNMPNLTPEGFHHLRIHKPDESVQYHLLIHPLKIRSADALKKEGEK